MQLHKQLFRLFSVLNQYKTVIITREHCGYCKEALEILKKERIDFKEIKREEHPSLVTEAQENTNHRTFPIIFLNKKFIGGCDNLKKIRENKLFRNYFGEEIKVL